MTNKNDIIYWLIAVVFLLPILFFPLGGDQTLYLMGGKTIAEGGKLYIDFIDLKPPLIYLLMAPVKLIFGFNEFAPRIFDFLWQLITILSFYFVVINRTDNKKLAFISIIVYSLLYSTLNFSQTVQCEGFLALPLVWLIYLQTKIDKSKIHYILIGITLAFIIALKYTFAIVLIALIIDFLLFKNLYKKKNLTNFLFSFLSFIFAFSIFSIVLFDPEIWKAYLDVLSYLSSYASYQHLNLALIKNSLVSIGNYFGDNYSLTFIGLSVLGLFYYIMQVDRFISLKEELHFRYFNINLIIMLFISIIIERKFIPYHFSRMFIPLSLIAGVGFIFIYEQLKMNWGIFKKYQKYLIIFIIFISIPFTPLPRWLGLLPGTYYFVTNREKYNNFYTKDGNNDLLRNQLVEVGNYIKDNSKTSDKLTVISVGTSAINYFSGLNNISKFGQSQFYFGKDVPVKWTSYFIQEIKRSNWLVIQNNDIHPLITGNSYSSYEAIKKNIKFYELIKKNFNLAYSTKDFLIYRKF